MKLLLAVALSVVAISPVVAQESAPGTVANEPAAAATAEATPPAPAVASEAKVKKICRTERTVGSNRPKRICFTREELDGQSQAARDAMMQGSRLRNNGTSGDL